jgi:hypothetical protein
MSIISMAASSRSETTFLVQVDIDVVEMMAEKGQNSWATVRATQVQTNVCLPLNSEARIILVDSILA